MVQRSVYIILGMVAAFSITLNVVVNPYVVERDIITTRIQSMQSCFFTATKFGKMDVRESEIFCENHSKDITENYRDISYQMEKITDEQYSFKNYYLKKIKKMISN